MTSPTSCSSGSPLPSGTSAPAGPLYSYVNADAWTDEPYAPGVVLHSCAYSVLALLWFTATHGSAASRSVATVLAIAAMGAIDESVQSFFPYRGASVHDWMVDCSAALFVCAVLWMVLPRAALQR